MRLRIIFYNNATLRITLLQFFGITLFVLLEKYLQPIRFVARGPLHV